MPKKARVWNEEELNFIRQLVTDGYSGEFISKKIGITRTTLAKILSNIGIKLQGNKISYDVENLIINLFKIYQNIDKVAKKSKYSRSTVQRVLVRRNIESRPRKTVYAENFAGSKIGKLLIIDKYNHGNKRKYATQWNAICDCGNTCRPSHQHLLKSTFPSCGRCLNIKKIGNIPSWLIQRYKRGAKKRNIEYHVTDVYLDELLNNQNGKCNYTGITLNINASKAYATSITASLDRIDPSFGYIVGNLQWIHKHINTMKSAYEHDYLLYLAKLCYMYLEYPSTVYFIDDIGNINISDSIWDEFYKRATTRHICEINKYTLEELLIKQRVRCKYTGQQLTLKKIKGEPQTTSIDRIDSTIGYIENNIQAVHKDINFLKFTYSDKYFQAIMKAIYLNDCERRYGFLPTKEKNNLTKYRKQILTNDCD